MELDFNQIKNVAYDSIYVELKEKAVGVRVDLFREHRHTVEAIFRRAASDLLRDDSKPDTVEYDEVRTFAYKTRVPHNNIDYLRHWWQQICPYATAPIFIPKYRYYTADHNSVTKTITKHYVQYIQTNSSALEHITHREYDDSFLVPPKDFYI